VSIYGTFFIVYIKWACELIRRLVVINPITCSFKNWQNLFKWRLPIFISSQTYLAMELNMMQVVVFRLYILAFITFSINVVGG